MFATVITLSATDTVFLIITAVCLSLYFILGSVLIILLIKITDSMRRVLSKAEDLIDSAEEVAEIVKDTKGKYAFYQVGKNIVKYVNKRKKK